MELLKEVAPRISNVAVLWNPDHADPEFREIQRAVHSSDVRIESLQVRQDKDLEPAFQAATKAKVEALIVVSSRLLNYNRDRIVDFTAKTRLPLIGDWGPWTTLGALFSYGPDISESVRRSAKILDKVLKGASPAEVPVERPTKFEFSVNMRAAQQLRLEIPQSVLYRADKVIK